MNLLDGGSAAQFLGGISEHFLIGRTVIEPTARAIDHRDHVRCILTDELKQLVTLSKLAPDSLELQVLVHRIDVEQQNEGRQPANPFPEISPVGSRGFGVLAEEGKKHNSRSQRQRDGYSESPKPPLPPFDLASAERCFPASLGSILKIE